MRSPKSITLQGKMLDDVKKEIESAYRLLRADISTSSGPSGIPEETDPVFIHSASYGITGTKINNWDTAYGWGNHAGLYTPIAHKTTEDAINGILKINGSGGYAAAIVGTDYQYGILTAGKIPYASGSPAILADSPVYVANGRTGFGGTPLSFPVEITGGQTRPTPLLSNALLWVGGEYSSQLTGVYQFGSEINLTYTAVPAVSNYMAAAGFEVRGHRTLNYKTSSPYDYLFGLFGGVKRYSDEIVGTKGYYVDAGLWFGVVDESNRTRGHTSVETLRYIEHRGINLPINDTITYNDASGLNRGYWAVKNYGLNLPIVCAPINIQSNQIDIENISFPVSITVTKPGTGVFNINSYGVKNLGITGADYNYFLYDDIGVQNVLAGNTRIGGTTTPTVALDVTGSAIISSQLTTALAFILSIKSGATQGEAGAAANEVWKTASHASLPDNVLMIGV